MHESAPDFGLGSPDSPVELDRSFYVAEGVAVAGVAVPPNENGWPAGPALVFVFRYPCRQHRQVEVVKFVVTDAGIQGRNNEVVGPGGLVSFAALVDEAARTAVDGYDAGVDKALAATAHAAALADPVLAPRCPGCGARLFAAVAERGACYGCFPESVPDEVLAAARPLG